MQKKKFTSNWSVSYFTIIVVRTPLNSLRQTDCFVTCGLGSVYRAFPGSEGERVITLCLCNVIGSLWWCDSWPSINSPVTKLNLIPSFNCFTICRSESDSSVWISWSCNIVSQLWPICPIIAPWSALSGGFFLSPASLNQVSDRGPCDSRVTPSVTVMSRVTPGSSLLT